VIALDIHPTALAAAGVNAQPEKKLDGVNLLPFLEGTAKGVPHEILFWRFGAQMAVRKGDWKLTLAAPRPPAGTPLTSDDEGEPQPQRKRARRAAPPQLYNLAQDIGESKDLTVENADKFKELKDDWDKWSSEMMAPRWGRANPNPQARRQKKQAN
jgi:arylsulfatase A-like enzyme